MDPGCLLILVEGKAGEGLISLTGKKLFMILKKILMTHLQNNQNFKSITFCFFLKKPNLEDKKTTKLCFRAAMEITKEILKKE